MAGTEVMSPDDIRREQALREAQARLVAMERLEEQRRLWHGASKFAPFAVIFLAVCFLGVVGFTAFKIMSDAWTATHWTAPATN